MKLYAHMLHYTLKATVENTRGSVEKLSPKESVEGAYTVRSGCVRAPEGFSDGKPKAAKRRGRSLGFCWAKKIHIFSKN